MQGKFHYLQKNALRMLTLAIYHGDLTPPAVCQKCGKFATVDGHHEDYSKPLDVIWLCRDCHKKEHKRDGDYRSRYRFRNSPKLQKALDYLRLNEGDLFTAPRELESKITGVSYGTIHKAQQIIRSENGDES